MRRRYPADLTDEQWAAVERLLPRAKRGGRPRAVDLRLVLDTLFYLAKTGCQWAMLPRDLAKRSTAHGYFAAWRDDGTWQKVLDALRRRVRTEAGREPEPRKAAIDSQTAKGSEAGGPRGYDGGKKVNGRKRHLVVDSTGLLPAVLVTGANADDGTTAPEVLKKLTPEHRRRLDELRGDGKYRNHALDRYLEAPKAAFELTVVERPKGVEGLVHLPYRRVAERTIAWVGKYRRNAKDYERTTESGEAMVQASMAHLMLKRLRPDPSTRPATFRYERKPLQKSA